MLFVAGTRPEGIKLIPPYKAFNAAGIPSLFCATEQHKELLQEVLDVFEVEPDFRLDVMKDSQDLFYLTSTILERVKKLLLDVRPSIVFVHGDTTTTFASALAAFYLHIPVAHVEAGLRTGDMRVPFPEEMNRVFVGRIATYNFAPTAFSVANLLTEGVDRTKVYCTGNTVVDALIYVKEKIKSGQLKISNELQQWVCRAKAAGSKICLLTAHRREAFGGGLTRVFEVVKKLLKENKNLRIIYPTHPNPNVQKALGESGLMDFCGERLFFSQPLTYQNAVYAIDNVDFVMTDSGGIQEEATSLGKPVLCLRDTTERWEGVWQGLEVLVGTDKDRIMEAAMPFIRGEKKEHAPSQVYGDGTASNQMVSIVKNIFASSLSKIKVNSQKTLHEVASESAVSVK
ncbi:UDP-N-acetylglucosamine 2-epimerase (non-hydrolyzing) [bacterium]|nr:UDP-N-acetylglucosamine 2-epimerase (non-hydrolyzing) [bacterium]